MQRLGTALLLTTLAGVSTGLGGVLALLRRPGQRLTAESCGFAAGVMLTVSLGDMLPAALQSYRSRMSGFGAAWAAVSLLALGAAIALLAARLLPQPEELLAQQALSGRQGAAKGAALRCAMAVGLALLLHNLPEGMLTLFSGLENPHLGLRLTLAVALHNIPEGLSVAVPLGYATGSRWKGILAAFASGLAEPAGGLLALLLVGDALTVAFLQGLMVVVSGIMCGVAAGQLFPGGLALEKPRYTVLGFLAGVLTMTAGIAVLG